MLANVLNSRVGAALYIFVLPPP